MLATLPALTEHGDDRLVGVDRGAAARRGPARRHRDRDPAPPARAPLPLFAGDRSHVYDQLVDRGWRVETSTALCVVVQGGLAALGVLAAGLEVDWAVGITAVTAVGILVLTASGGFLGRATD